MSASTHPIAPEEIMALVDGELSADQAQSLSAHLQSCGECRDLAASLRSTSQRLSDWTIPNSDSPELDGLLAEAARSVSSAHRPEYKLRLVPFFRRHWILTAASSAVAAGAFLMFSTTSPRMAPTPRAAESLAVDKAQAKQVWSTALREEPGIARPEDLFSRFDGAAKPRGGMGSSLGKLQPSDTQIVPMIVRTVSLSLIAKDFSASRDSLDAILARHHGYAATLTASNEQNAARSLQASLRIPAGELNAAVLELKSLGRVQNESQNGEEVTQQHADLITRLKNSRETELRLQDILRNRTGKISDVLAVEQEIARVRGEIEQMEGEQKSLEHRVDFATIDLKLSEEYKAHLDSPSPSVATRFHNAFVSGYRSAAETIISLLLFLVEVGPSLLIWAILFFPILWLLWRRWRRSMVIASSVS